MSGERSLLRRDRLLSVLGRRFGVRLIVLQGGAGFGKSTLLRQAIAENELDPRGVDVYVPMPARRADVLDLATMLHPRLDPDWSGGGIGDASLRQVADAVWAQAPNEVTLIIDDLHRVRDQPGLAADLHLLLEDLPTNGHIVLASRQPPPVSFRAMVARGEALVLNEADLRFDDQELGSFARLRGSNPADLGDDGWPALAELRATVGSAADKEFVAEEILSVVDDDQLQALRRLVLHGRFDDDLVARCTSYKGRAAELAAQLPLTSFDGEWYLLHDLWPTMLPSLDPAEEEEACVALAMALERRDDLVSAVQLLVRARQFDDVRRLLIELARDFAARHGLSDRRRVLASLPDSLRETAAARVVEADLLFLPSPPTARHALEHAAGVAEAAGEPELEALAVFRLAELAFRAAENSELRRHLARLTELALDLPAISSLARLVRVWDCMSSEQLDTAIQFLATESSDYPPNRAYEDFYRVVLLSHAGHAAATLEALAEVLARLPGRLQARASGARYMSLYWSGQMTPQELASVTDLVGRIAATEDSQLFVEGACITALFHLGVGEVRVADQLFAAADERVAVVSEPGDWTEHVVGMFRATRLLLDGDEAAARQLLETTIPADGPFAGLSPHLYMNIMTLAYFLVPRARPYFSRVELGVEGARALAIGEALVALREDGETAPAAALDWSKPELIRPWAFEPHLAELAVAALSCGVTEAEHAIAELRHDPHGALSAVAKRSKGRVATTAERLLKSTPRRPNGLTQIQALGPLTVLTGQPADEAAPRRRVIELLALLVLNDRVTRAEICLALWPDFEESRARNNLGVNLSYLRRLLEPQAERGAESWHVATHGEFVFLVRSEFLRLDTDDFSAAVSSGHRADAAGLPGTALEEYLRATALYRGELFPELRESEVGSVERTRFQLDFVTAATRAANLLTASGRPEEAVDLGRRAVQAEPLSEPAHAALLRALNSSGYTTRGAMDECRGVFAEAGLPLSRELSVLVDQLGADL